MSMQNSSLRKVGIIAAVVAVLAAASVWYIQNEVEKQVRAGGEAFLRKAGGVPTLGQISYNLLSNTLEIKDIKVAMPQQGQPVDYKISRIVLKNPNRSLIMAVVSEKLAEQKGTLVAAEELSVENYEAAISSLADEKMQLQVAVNVPLQIVRGMSVDMDVLGPVLANPNRTEIDTIVAIAQSCAYASRSVPSGMTGDVSGNAIQAKITAGVMEETNFGRCALERGTIKNLTMKGSGSGEKIDVSVDELTLERIFISPEALRLSLSAQQNPSADPEPMLMAMFLGERPLIGLLSVKGINVINAGQTSKMGLFRFENSSTKPFAASLKIENLPVDLNMVPEGAMLIQLAGKSEVNVNMEFSALVPVDTKALIKGAMAVSAQDLGSMSMKTEGSLAPDFTWAESASQEDELINNFLVENLTASYTDQSLAARGVKLASSMMGLQPDLAIGFVQNMIKGNAGSTISPPNMVAIDDFISNPGTITLSVTPEQPMPLAQLLDSLDLGADKTVLETVKGEKSLADQVKALQ